MIFHLNVVCRNHTFPADWGCEASCRIGDVDEKDMWMTSVKDEDAALAHLRSRAKALLKPSHSYTHIECTVTKDGKRITSYVVYAPPPKETRMGCNINGDCFDETRTH